MDYKQLLFDLYNSPSSEDVYNVITKYNLDEPKNWKPYGGIANNAGTFESQQASAENALVEKLTNSIDAILMKKCYENGINPKAKDGSVPEDMDKAIELFYGVKDGKWENITDSERNNIAQNIQIIVSSDKTTPNVAIYDNGEGQNPVDFPSTFLSLLHGNKTEIPFVQGKYNMGATGAVVFCGETHRYQMIISRRSTSMPDADNRIGFTVVRKHVLTQQEEKEVKLSWYEYLVIDDEIPSIPAEPLDLGLNKGVPFVEGSIVKMFSYQLTRPSIATIDLWRELNPLLFFSAIPILIYETRDYKGNTPTKLMLGNRTRVSLDERNKLYFHKSLSTELFNSRIPIDIYVFTRDTKNPEFINAKSVIYTLNGQTQGFEGKTFISQDLGFRNLREYMLVAIDCSSVGATARNEIFMSSRDRLKQSKSYFELRDDIISLIKSDENIKELDQIYKGKAFKEKGEDKEMIESIFSQLKNNQDIKKMFSGANGAFSFFTKKKKTDESEEGKEKSKEKKEKPKLHRYPTILRVKGFDTDKEDYVKTIRRGGKGRITLETDVENDFLSRSSDNGSIEITTLDYSHHGGGGGGGRIPTKDAKILKVQYSGPYDGEMQIIVSPKEDAEIGVSIPLSVKMISSEGEHEVIMFIKIAKEMEQKEEKEKKPKEEPEMALPKLTRVVKENPAEDEATWSDVDMNADSIIKLRIGSEGEIETIFINMDSNVVKKLINSKGINIERVRNKYLMAVYSHSLMVYTTLYGYYKDAEKSEKYENHTIKEIEAYLNEAVEFSFRYYTNFLMSFDDFTD